MKFSASRELYEEVAQRAETCSRWISIVAIRVLPLYAVIALSLTIFFLYYVYDLSNDAFILAVPMWWVPNICESLQIYAYWNVLTFSLQIEGFHSILKIRLAIHWLCWTRVWWVCMLFQRLFPWQQLRSIVFYTWLQWPKIWFECWTMWREMPRSKTIDHAS